MPLWVLAQVLDMMAGMSLEPDEAMYNALMGECLRVAEGGELPVSAVGDAAAAASGESAGTGQGLTAVDDGDGAGAAGGGCHGWHGVEWMARVLSVMADHVAGTEQEGDGGGQAVAWRLYRRLSALCAQRVCPPTHPPFPSQCAFDTCLSFSFVACCALSSRCGRWGRGWWWGPCAQAVRLRSLPLGCKLPAFMAYQAGRSSGSQRGRAVPGQIHPPWHRLHHWGSSEPRSRSA